MACACAVLLPVVHAQTPARRPPSPTSPTFASSVALEFELPSEFSDRAPDGRYRVAALQAGYFGPGGRLVGVVEIPREAIQVTGRTARASIPAFALPTGDDRVSIRLRSLASGRLGEWSDAVGPVTLPELPVVPRPDRQARDRRGAVTVGQLEGRPVLRDALRPLLAEGFSEQDAVAAFRRLPDLAAAVALARAQVVPLPALARAVKGPPVVTLEDAFHKLKPSVDVSAALKTARAEARTLLKQARRGRQQGRA